MKNEYDFNRYPQFERHPEGHDFIEQNARPASRRGRRSKQLGTGWVVALILLAEIVFYAVVLSGNGRPEARVENKAQNFRPSLDPSASPRPNDGNSFSQK